MFQEKGQEMIRTEKLTKDFGNGRGVFSVDIFAPKGAIYGFVGHNGAGKTTAIKLLCGLLKPDSGAAYIGDVQITPANIQKVKRKLGYMPDITGVYDQMSVWEFLDFYGAAYKIPPKERKKRVEEVLALTNASHMIDYQVASLSRGMRQKVGLAKTMIHDPDVLILDEPAGGLDPNARIEMRGAIQRLKDLGKTILLSSHILPELSNACDLVGIINRGKLLAQGTVKEITAKLKENLSIEISVDGEVDRAVELLKNVHGVDSVRAADESQIFAVFSGTREEVSPILTYLVNNGIPVRWFQENEADLENVFMDLTRQDGAPAAKDSH